MLLSEFIERTGENVTGDVYANVEKIYNEMSINKDIFCDGWKRLKNDAFVADLMDTILSLTQAIEKKSKEIEKLNWGIKHMINMHENELKGREKSANKNHEGFATRIIALLSDEMPQKIWDEIEQEFGYLFIIQKKRELGIPLDNSEIDYLIKNCKV